MTKEEHLYHQQLTFQVLQDHTTFVKRSKCEFGLQQLAYLGHFVSVSGVQPNLDKILANSNFDQTGQIIYWFKYYR